MLGSRLSQGSTAMWGNVVLVGQQTQLHLSLFNLKHTSKLTNFLMIPKMAASRLNYRGSTTMVTKRQMLGGCPQHLM